MASLPHEFCKYGHRMSETRVIRPNGSSQCGVCLKQRVKEWHYRHLDRAHACSRDWHLRKNYGLSSADFEMLATKQNYKCAICPKNCSGKGRLVVDHDHKTGKVRGLLCSDCNMGLGKFRDDVTVLTAAAKYLEG